MQITASKPPSANGQTWRSASNRCRTERFRPPGPRELDVLGPGRLALPDAARLAGEDDLGTGLEEQLREQEGVGAELQHACTRACVLQRERERACEAPRRALQVALDLLLAAGEPAPCSPPPARTRRASSLRRVSPSIVTGGTVACAARARATPHHRSRTVLRAGRDRARGRTGAAPPPRCARPVPGLHGDDVPAAELPGWLARVEPFAFRASHRRPLRPRVCAPRGARADRRHGPRAELLRPRVGARRHPAAGRPARDISHAACRARCTASRSATAATSRWRCGRCSAPPCPGCVPSTRGSRGGPTAS